jgi:hypothetical protein
MNKETGGSAFPTISIDNTKEDFICRKKIEHFAFAKLQHKFDNEVSMWIHLLLWAQAQDFYGDQWDRVKALQKEKQ